MAKSRTDQLAERLHAAGLQKRVAQTLADAQRHVPKRGKPPTTVQRTLDELRSLVAEIEGRFTGRSSSSSSSSKRTAAAKKGAATRKKNAGKRSASAHKGAKTRVSGRGKTKTKAKA